MKQFSGCLRSAVFFFSAAFILGSAHAGAPFVYESGQEFFGTADLDGDGRLDVVIVDKASGKFRPGYQTAPGVLTWVDCRVSGIKDVTGFSLGHLLFTNRDALAFTSPNDN